MDWIPDFDPDDEPFYLTVLRSLETDIESGRLPTGYRLPTHRQLARKLGVAVGTVTRAYSEAEQRGLIHGEGRRGTFVGACHRGRLALASLTEARAQVIDLGINYPVYAEDPDLGAALRQVACRSHCQELLHYPPAAGLPRHREAGAAWLRTLGLAADPGSVIVTAGAQHAMSVVLASITRPGDTVLTEGLTYPGIKAIADLLGVRLAGVPVDQEGLIPGALEAASRKLQARILYCIPTLQNPTNAVLSDQRRREIAALAEKLGLTIIEDEIHRRLHPQPPTLLASLVPERTYLIASPSKVVAGGLRVGFVTAPAAGLRSLVEALQATTIAVSPLAAEVFATWLGDGTAEATIERRQREAEARQRICREVLGLPATAATSYFVWFRLPEPWGRLEFTLQAQRRGVAVAPADTFVIPGCPIPDAVRISLGTVDSQDRLRAGLEILRDLLASAPGRDLSAM